MKQTTVKNLFGYIDGSLMWKVKRRGTPLDKVAGSIDKKTLYLRIMIDGESFLAHRLIYLYHNPSFEISKSRLDNKKTNQIDHIDGDRTNNCIENLRLVTCQQNNFNRTTAKGYSFEPRRNKWRASICTNGKNRIIGRYKTESEARDAYLSAKELEHII